MNILRNTRFFSSSVVPVLTEHTTATSVTVAGGITLGPALQENTEISSISSAVTSLRTNVLPHVRASLAPPISARVVSPAPSLLDRLLPDAGSREKALSLFDGQYQRYALKAYSQGQVAAYHYPPEVLPVRIAMRIPSDFRVEPLQWGKKSELLIDKCLGKPLTAIFVFSGEGFSSTSSGVNLWKKALAESGEKMNIVQLHMHTSWLSRKTHMLTRMLLKDAARENADSTFVAKGKLRGPENFLFHTYDRNLPAVLLVDARGYVRWHAVGLPTEESLEIALGGIRRMAREKPDIFSC